MTAFPRASPELASAEKRHHALDSIRGFAALGVVAHHCFSTLPSLTQAHIVSWARYTPLRLFVMGRPFVIIFFVLSGFVLASSLRGGDSTISYRSFVMKRLFRIYVPYLLSIAFSICIFELVQPSEIEALNPLDHWISETWDGGVTLNIVAAHLFLSGTPSGSTLNIPNWSLVYELRISLIFPVMVGMLRLLGSAIGGILLLGIAGLADAILLYSGQELAPYYADTPGLAIVVTAHFTLYFTIGAILFRTLPLYRPMLSGLGLPAHFIMLAVAGVLLLIRVDAVQGIGAGLLIVSTISAARLSRLLERKLPQFLGRISFSLYLIHIPILVGLTHVLYGHVSQPIIFGLTLTLSIGLAAFTYKYVELPAIWCGRLLSRQIDRGPHEWAGLQKRHPDGDDGVTSTHRKRSRSASSMELCQAPITHVAGAGQSAHDAWPVSLTGGGGNEIHTRSVALPRVESFDDADHSITP